jgi:DNA mismatch repair protein MutS
MTTPALETPMMRQYLGIKARHPDAIVFYRMGDFYEMFLRDAELAAPLLDITLTTRDKGKPDAVPMCGVPVHAADQHVKRLVELGHRVAICEQVEAPAKAGASGRKLVRRDVVEVVTPGLVGDPQAIEAAREVCLVALAPPLHPGDGFGLAALDASTGDCRATSAAADADGGLAPALLEEIARIAPREILLPAGAGAERWARRLGDAASAAARTEVPAASFDPDARAASTAGADARAGEGARAVLLRHAAASGLEGPAARAAAALLAYLAANQPFALRHTSRVRPYRLADAMLLDGATRAHLELFESAEDRSRRGTLIERIDETRTPPGARRLARWLAYPLVDPSAIAVRADAVAFLADADRVRGRLRDALRGVRDLERLLAKVARPAATPRDLVALRRSLEALPAVAAALESGDGESLPGVRAPLPPGLPRVATVPEAARLVAEALVDDPPPMLRGSRGAGDTGFVREGYRADLDALLESARKGREWIAGLEARERERTGLAGLKVRFHPVHGYGIEITKSQLGRAPEGYERKQTLASAERFTTPELREVERSVLGAGERAAALEREIFEGVRQALLEFAPALRAAADAVATLDALASLAEVARRDGWARPVVDASERLEIRAGRHPVVERLGRGDFVPNDTELDPGEAQILLLTGPNMSGKSTYLRQVALLVLLAQIGSFVPAEGARIGVVDRVFTRVGASDRLARGESTFMVEMRETAGILAQASRRSLVILDEIGRGTSTFDGLSIAWAVAEHLHDAPDLRPRTLFATHYHELTDLARTKPRVRNAHFEVREWGEEVVFLRRLVPGGASRSYGIQVARLAGLPGAVIARAKEVLANLEGEELDEQGRPRLARAASTPRAAAPQLGLFAEPEAASASRAERAAEPAPSAAVAAIDPEARRALALREELLAIDPDRTTPIDALLALQRLVARARRAGPDGEGAA